MAKTKKTEAAATETAQKTRNEQGMSQDVREDEGISAVSEEGQEGTVAREVAGPTSENELLGCQEEAELEETEFVEYAVAGCKRLNLRQDPSLNAPVVAELPCGVGVLGSTWPAENGWRQVFTGRLFGWVMDKFLEPLELSEMTNAAE